jgi:bifunctional non-homologous end joining protein LigD
VPARGQGSGASRGRAGRLEGYRAKRDFARTPEPAPSKRGLGEEGGRFVIHEHHAHRLHWDLRLERDGVLASWAIPKGLPEAPGENRFAAHTEDHPLEYLDFHGEIPAGEYGAGTMGIWDSGTYECLKWEPRKVEVALHGSRVDARYALFAIQPGESASEWMIHRMDPPADPGREPMPRGLAPMLARSGEIPRDTAGWAFEIKWDGVRALAYSTPGELHLQSRNLTYITASYPELRRLGRALGSHSAILDGEIVALDDAGRPSFQALQRRMHVTSPAQVKRLAQGTPVTYMIFDLLWLDGHPLTDLAYVQRRELLAGLRLAGDRWQTPDHALRDGAGLLAAAAEQDLEGIVAKRLDSTYQPGLRSRAWVKVKAIRRQEFVIGGWLPRKGSRAGPVGALLLGVHDPDGALRHVGRVGSGFTDAELERLGALLEPLRRDSSPFSAGPTPPRESVFCEPRVVAEVAFTQWTSSGSLRQPSYKGLREDKPAAEVVREDPGEADAGGAAAAPGGATVPAGARASATIEVDGRELKLTNLDKAMYPAAGFAKRDLIEYYAAVAPVLLAHLAGRALTVTRWPDGVEGKSFFQKQAPAHRPGWVPTATLQSSSKPIDYVLAEDLPTLVWLANLAAIELHAPLSLAQAPQRPTVLVFDLDPGEPAGVLQCGEVALRLRGMLAQLGIESSVKTSGSKGLQVYVPLNHPAASYAHTKAFAKAVAEVMERDEPELIVSRMTKARRTGRVLIDWSQNDARKTTVSVYSLRALARPTASTPLRWEELDAAVRGGDADALAFEAGEALARIAEHGDLFATVISLVQELPPL